MAATELQDLSGMEEVYRQQKDKLVFQSVLGINPSTSTQGTQTHIIWKYVESLEWTTQYLTTVKTDLHERVNDSELTKESLKNDKEKMILALFHLAFYKATPQRNNGSHSIYFNHHLLVLMRAELKATVKSYVFKVYYSTSTVEIFFRGNAYT